MKKIWEYMQHHYRRLLLFLADMVLTTLMYTIGWFIFRGTAALNPDLWWVHWLLVMACTALPLFLFHCYDSLWRYADSKEYLVQFLAVLSGFFLYLLTDRLLVPKHLHYSCRFVLFVMLMSLVGMWIMRFMWRLLRQYSARRQYNHRQAVPVVIIGAGDAGVDLAEEIKRNNKAQYYIVGFFDDDPAKQKMTVRGVPVLGTIDSMVEQLKDIDVRDIILAIPSASQQRQSEILEICSHTGCKVRLLPRLSEWMQQQPGTLFGRVRDIRVEDLLGRAAVVFDNPEVYEFVMDKVIMVTGGGGSIGSELCRQIATHSPRSLIIVDIYENNAYDIQQELRYTYGNELDLHIEIASVRDKAKIEQLFRRYHPQIVFHAAAHKHVPLMEDCPEEAIKNNVFGTFNVAQTASDYGAEKFILISTDKAVNPTNVMGASKRMCEMIMQSMQEVGNTKYVAVRFGNVLGSNGSVIPLFKKQLEHGGPLTVTDRRIIRYFMTIPEAAQLVMQAGAMADSSEIFVLDMGKPVSILSLAENLIKLTGYRPYEDIDIVETGLRPGEKLYEELLVQKENLASTKYEKIFVEQRGHLPYKRMLADLERRHQVLETEDKQQIVQLMREIVPTFHTPEEVNAQRIREEEAKAAASASVSTPVKAEAVAVSC